MMEPESFAAPRLGANDALVSLLHPRPTAAVHNTVDAKLRPAKMSRDTTTAAKTHNPTSRPDTRPGVLVRGGEAAAASATATPAVAPACNTTSIAPTSSPSLLLQLCDATEVHGRVNLADDARSRAAAAGSSSTSHASQNPPASAADSLKFNPAASRRDLSNHHHYNYRPPMTTLSASIATSAAKQPMFTPDHHASESSHSQESNSSTATDRVFTPPASDGDMSVGYDNTQGSSQESQLFRLSQIAALQDKMDDTREAAVSRKRMADGKVKNVEERTSTSPVRRGGHSRNTSTVSLASTSGSRIGELSAELKTRLSYAMVKVNHGWHSHSIDEVESLASQASPTSSPSTIARRPQSASPALSQTATKPSNATPPASQSQSPYESWNDSSRRPQDASDVGGHKVHAAYGAHAALAPPAPIQPSSSLSQPNGNGRNARPNYTPTLLSQSHSASPRTPGASPYPSQNQPGARGSMVDPILFSPHQNVRDQDAIEALIFMSSPGNSANLKHSFSPTASPQSSSLRPPGQRHALPTAQPRKSLPSGRPGQAKRVGFEKSPATSFGGEVEMDIDSPQMGSPYGSKGTPRRRPGVNGTGHMPSSSAPGAVPSFRSQFSVPTAPVSSQPRPQLGDADIERMLEKASQAESSDDEDEIQLPPNPRRPRPNPVSSSSVEWRT